MKVKVFTVEILRENGDPDVLYLCKECLPTITDFAKVTKKQLNTTAQCDRCGN